MTIIKTSYPLRLATPLTSDKNYMHYSAGGYNYCIKIQSNGSCMPNCTGYAWGRWRELLGAYHNLSRADAENWWGNTNDGYERGRTPKVGAVMCWYGNGTLAGHVAIVEKINADGSIVISQSNYGGINFETLTTSGRYNISKGLEFQGFIYLPNEYVEITKEEKEEDDIMKAWRFYRNETDTTVFWFDGSSMHLFAHPDEAYIINEIYKEEYGTSVKSVVYKKDSPWDVRLTAIANRKGDIVSLEERIKKIEEKLSEVADMLEK